MRIRHWLVVIALLAPTFLLLEDRERVITFWLSAAGALGLGAILSALVALLRRIDPATFPLGIAWGWMARLGMGALALLCFLSVLIMAAAAVDQVVIGMTGQSLILPIIRE